MYSSIKDYAIEKSKKLNVALHLTCSLNSSMFISIYIL